MPGFFLSSKASRRFSFEFGDRSTSTLTSVLLYFRGGVLSDILEDDGFGEGYRWACVKYLDALEVGMEEEIQ